jgi:hypothetical protein
VGVGGWVGGCGCGALPNCSAGDSASSNVSDARPAGDPYAQLHAHNSQPNKFSEPIVRRLIFGQRRCRGQVTQE